MLWQPSFFSHQNCYSWGWGRNTKVQYGTVQFTVQSLLTFLLRLMSCDVCSICLVMMSWLFSSRFRWVTAAEYRSVPMWWLWSIILHCRHSIYKLQPAHIVDEKTTPKTSRHKWERCRRDLGAGETIDVHHSVRVMSTWELWPFPPLFLSVASGGKIDYRVVLGVPRLPVCG